MRWTKASASAEVAKVLICSVNLPLALGASATGAAGTGAGRGATAMGACATAIGACATGLALGGGAAICALARVRGNVRAGSGAATPGGGW